VEKGQGYGQNNHLLPPLPHDTKQRRGSTGRPVGGGGRGAGDPVHGDGREVGQNEEDLEGNKFRSLPWLGTDCGGRSTAGGGLLAVVAGAALVVAMEGSGGRERWSWMCGVRWGAVSYGPPWALYLGGYQDRLIGGPLGLPDLCCTIPDGMKHKDYRGEVLG
jgi:hypothetical protein